jgi:hypothetical protein
MPYTKTELENGTVEFYDKFINKLRTTYLNRLAGHATSSFRDKFNVLYSYEDINTGDGIEDVNIDTPTSLYHGLMTKEQQKEQSVTSENEVPLYTQEILLDKVISRGFSELKKVTFADELPEGIVNGDLLSTSDPNDSRKWLVENNQRRRFADLSTLFAGEFDFSKFKVYDIKIIKQIPEGDLVD